MHYFGPTQTYDIILSLSSPFFPLSPSPITQALVEVGVHRDNVL